MHTSKNSKYFCVLFLTSLGLLLSCQDSKETKEQRHIQQHLTLNAYAEPPSLDPGTVSDALTGHVLAMLYEGLTRRDEDAIQPTIARQISISPDAKTYTFHLRETKWSNGDPLTAYDFEYSWKRMLSPSFPSGLANMLYIIKGAQAAKQNKAPLENVAIQAVDALTLVVELEEPAPYFLELVQLPFYAPVHKATVERNPNWAGEASKDYISNGPFRMVAWSHHDSIVLEPNPYYYDADSIKLKKITLLMIDDSNTELDLYQSGALDWAGQPLAKALAPDAIDALIESGAVYFDKFAATTFYFFNVNQAPFDNVKMRRALAYAINRQDIVKNITRAGETAATGVIPPSLCSQEHAFFEDNNSITAKRLFNEALEEIGITKEQLPPITLTYYTSQLHAKVAQAIQQQWYTTLDIEVRLENLEWKVFLDHLNARQFSIAGLSLMGLYSDPFTFHELFRYPNMSHNICNWEDTQYRNLLEQAVITLNNEQRMTLLLEAEKRMMDQMPLIPLFFPTSASLRDPHLKGYYVHPTGFVDFRNACFDCNPS
jgi:oligopeptide transport system substrate-binding protein